MKCRRCTRTPLVAHGEAWCIVHGTVYELQPIPPEGIGSARQHGYTPARISNRDRRILAGEVPDDWGFEERLEGEILEAPSGLDDVALLDHLAKRLDASPRAVLRLLRRSAKNA
jgi:hypothetical protein